MNTTPATGSQSEKEAAGGIPLLGVPRHGHCEGAQASNPGCPAVDLDFVKPIPLLLANSSWIRDDRADAAGGGRPSPYHCGPRRKGERMTAKWRKVIVMLMACAVAGAFSAPAFSAPLHPKPKCNAGNGNASETDPSNDCDPGNSVKNNGGD